MLLLLPPSETKRDGGDADAPLDLTRLSHSELTAARRTALAATRALSRNRTTAAAALKLGATQQFEVTRNRELRSSPTRAALDRYTGVLYDALDAGSLDAGARQFARDHVLIHSALFGLLGADDPIPAYRLSHDSRLPELTLRKLWRERISAVLAASDGVVLDLRSEAYVELGPAPAGAKTAFVRVVTDSADGPRRALNHFNKKGKGEFVRALCQAGIDHPTIDSVLQWSSDAGLRLERGAEGELDLVV
ncbi:YaaA family protein [Lacisediminihabitans sp. FW035]